jgi:hypothetical protein
LEAKRESISYITKRPIPISTEEMKKEFANKVRRAKPHSVSFSKLYLAF